MRTLIRILGILSALAGFLLLTFLAWTAPGAVSAQVEATATPTQAMPPQMFTFTEGILIDLPPDATQAQYGWEVYRLVCSACHAYNGTGLTDEWRSQWHPQDQNCWQSKCHALNHPPDGFYLPYSPPVVGEIIPAMFETAQDMYDYIYNYMPWHDPGMLTEKEAWAVTSHLLWMNEYERPDILGPENASQIRLRPEQPVEALSDEDQQPEPANARTWVWGLSIALTVVLVVLIILMIRRQRASAN